MAVQRIGQKMIKVQIYLELEDIKNIKRFAEQNNMTFSSQARKLMEPSIKWHLKKEEEKAKKQSIEEKPISDFSSEINNDFDKQWE